MKKLLLLSALAFCGLAANAQNLTVTVNGQPVENGSEVTSTHFECTDEEWGSYQLLPHVMVTSDVATDVSVMLFNTTDASAMPMGVSPFIQLCFPNGCEAIAPDSRSKEPHEGLIEANTPTDLVIDSAEFYPLDEPQPGSFTLSGNVTISAGSTTFAFVLNMTYDPELMSVDGIEADEAEAVYYNLSGVQVANPDRGIFIKKQGAKTQKVII